MPPLQIGPPTPFEQRLNDLINSPLRSESSTAALPYGSSTAFRQPGPLMAPFEYKPPIAHKKLASKTAPGKSGPSTAHIKPRSSSAKKDRGPPRTPGNPDSSKTHRPSSSRTAPLNNNLSKALKQSGSQRYIPEPEPLNVFRQADQRDPLMPPFDSDPSTALNQLSLSPPWRPTPPITQKRFGAGTARQQKDDALHAAYQPGSWRHGPQQSETWTTADQAGSSTAHHAEARSRAAPAPSDLSAAPGEEESYRDWWRDDGHDHPDKGGGRR